MPKHENPLKIWRKSKGHSLDIAAKIFKVSRSAFAAWEYDLDIPCVSTLVLMNNIINDLTALKFIKWKIEKYRESKNKD